MIASYRTPATVSMTVGGSLFVLGFMLPIIFSPAPEGVLHARTVVSGVAFVIFGTGCCLYAKGNGYSAFLGLFGLTVIGLLMLMLLPDRFPEEPGDDN